MNRIQQIFISLKSRWFFILLILIQLTIGMAVLTMTASYLLNLKSLKNNSVLNLDSTYLLVGAEQVEKESWKYSEKDVDQIYQNLRNHPDVQGIGTYQTGSIILDKDNRTMDSRLLEDLTDRRMAEMGPMIETLLVDEFYEQNFLELNIEGQRFTKDDFRKKSGETLPVLAGPYFKEYFKIGDTINGEYVIRGFLPENKYIVDNNTTDLYKKLDRLMITPMPVDLYTDPVNKLIRLGKGTVLKLNPLPNLAALNRIIQVKDSLDPMKLKSFGDEVRKVYDEDVDDIVPTLIFGAAFLLLLVIGIVMTTIILIRMKKREIGIRLAIGESKRSFFFQLLLENTLILVTGMAMGVLTYTISYGEVLEEIKRSSMASARDIKIDFFTLFYIAIFLFVIMAAVNYFIYLYIRRLEPKTLIGGMD